MHEIMLIRVQSSLTVVFLQGSYCAIVDVGSLEDALQCQVTRMWSTSFVFNSPFSSLGTSGKDHKLYPCHHQDKACGCFCTTYSYSHTEPIHLLDLKLVHMHRYILILAVHIMFVNVLMYIPGSLSSTLLTVSVSWSYLGQVMWNFNAESSLSLWQLAKTRSTSVLTLLAGSIADAIVHATVGAFTKSLCSVTLGTVYNVQKILLLCYECN